MLVTGVINLDPALGCMAFKATSPDQQDAFVLINKSEQSKQVNIQIMGSAKHFLAYRTMENEKYTPLGETHLKEGTLVYDCPPRSVTTFFAVQR
jgi:hypothetical protein